MQKTVLDYPVEWLEVNPAGERLILLLHGFGASTFSWRTVTGPLAELGHVVAYDRPGFGFTPIVERGDPDCYSLAGQVLLLKAIVEHNAKGRPVVVVGHSAGALVATEFALLHPELVSALVLESPAIWSKPPVPRFAGAIMRGAAMEHLGDRLLKSFAKAGMKILNDSFFDPAKLTDEVVSGYTAPMSRDEWRVALWRFMTAVQSNSVRDNLWRLEMPVLVITGDHDRIVKVEDTFKVAERITGHSIYLVPNTGHLAHEEDPTDFLRVVTRFIAKLRA